MGLIKCPECKKKISDKVQNCPKCGCPITDDIKATAIKVNTDKKELTKEEKERLKKAVKRAEIIGASLIVLCVIAVLIYYFTNIEKIKISKAQEYINNQQYEKVIDTLEKYKDDEDAKSLYDEATFMTSEKGRFLLDFADGLEERWSLNASDPQNGYKILVNAELNRLSKYDKVTFDDAVFNEKAHAYIQALKTQLSAIDYYVTDYSKYSDMWSEGYSERSVLITYFLSNYPVPIDEKYADVKLEFQSAAKGIEAQAEFDSLVEMMIHKNNFINSKSSSSWKTYEISITNETDKTFTYFGLDVNCLDAEGKILEQKNTNQINGFAPGQTASFEFSTDKKPVSFTWKADYYME